MTVSWSDDFDVTDDPDRFEQAVAAFRRLLPVTDDEFDQLSNDEKTRAFWVAGVADADLVQDVFDAVDDAVANGTAFEDFADAVGADLEAAWGEGGGSLETVFRTNVLGAYNAGRADVFNDPDVRNARPYWRFDAIDDDRTDEDCQDADGTVLEADDPWWQTHQPPLHPNCRCTFVALTPDEADEEGIDQDGPDSAPADGFGGPSSDEDWEPDTARFDDAIASVLQGQIDDAE